MKKIKILSVFIALIMVSGIFSGLIVSTNAASPEDNSAENPYGLLDDVQGSLILHCWCWNFNTIKDNIENIAKAGYTAVQTSPINKVLEGEGGGLKIKGEEADGKWYFQYQPVAFTIGNYQLGTEEEFKAMCDEAHKYGVKVIVDVVANHTTPTKSAVAEDLKNIEGGLYHTYNGSSNKAARKSVTQWYSGLPDINTQNPNYQQLILNYLKQCVADGADGFRYDAAKHIELPEDDPEYASEFWPVILNNGSSFQYGEVLQTNDETDFAAYTKYMSVTASSYGGKIRNYLLSLDTPAKTLADYSAEGADADKLVTWVESHDTYANVGKANNSATSFWLDNSQIRKGWAIVAARGTTSLFFSRPMGSSTDKIWGDNLIGPAGDDNYRNEEVVAVNRFHNAMNGESSAIRNLNSNPKNVMVMRGNKGAVIINSDTKNDLILNANTTILNGTYKDTVTNEEFIIKDGKLTGTVKADSIVVLDSTDSEHYSSEIAEPTTEALTTEPTTAQPAVEETTTAAPSATEPKAQPSTEKKQTNNTTKKTTAKAKTKKNNPVKFTVSKKTLKAKKLKKKSLTVKCLTIKKAKGKVEVVKVKKGTDKKIYKKITVKKSTGAITFKKGKYTKKTYKIKLKIKVKGNSSYKPKNVTKTVKVKIK